MYVCVDSLQWYIDVRVGIIVTMTVACALLREAYYQPSITVASYIPILSSADLKVTSNSQ